jgi:GDPmannose 4,6-dehydratase
MWQMLQLETPCDLVISSGQSYSVREFIELTARLLNLELTWRGTGVDEKAFLAGGQLAIEVKTQYFRPLEVNRLQGNSKLAHQVLGWHPRSNLENLIRDMIQHEESFYSPRASN